MNDTCDRSGAEASSVSGALRLTVVPDLPDRAPELCMADAGLLLGLFARCASIALLNHDRARAEHLCTLLAQIGDETSSTGSMSVSQCLLTPGFESAHAVAAQLANGSWRSRRYGTYEEAIHTAHDLVVDLEWAQLFAMA